MDLIVCDDCQYPHQDDGKGCPNPQCLSNPTLSTERKAAIVVRREEYAREEADRVKRRELLRQSFNGVFSR